MKSINETNTNTTENTTVENTTNTITENTNANTNERLTKKQKVFFTILIIAIVIIGGLTTYYFTCVYGVNVSNTYERTFSEKDVSDIITPSNEQKYQEEKDNSEFYEEIQSQIDVPETPESSKVDEQAEKEKAEKEKAEKEAKTEQAKIEAMTSEEYVEYVGPVSGMTMEQGAIWAAKAEKELDEFVPPSFDLPIEDDGFDCDNETWIFGDGTICEYADQIG